MKLELQERRLIEAPIEEAWRVLAEIGRIHEWAPGLADTTVTAEGPVGEGALRTITYDKPVLGKKSLTERFTHWQAGRGHVYEVQGGLGPFHAMRNQWWLDEKGPHTALTFNSRMHTKNPLIKLGGPYVRHQAAKALVPLLDAFKAHVEGGPEGTQRFLEELKQKQQGGSRRPRSSGGRPGTGRPAPTAAKKSAKKTGQENKAGKKTAPPAPTGSR